MQRFFFVLTGQDDVMSESNLTDRCPVCSIEAFESSRFNPPGVEASLFVLARDAFQTPGEDSLFIHTKKRNFCGTVVILLDKKTHRREVCKYNKKMIVSRFIHRFKSIKINMKDVFSLTDKIPTTATMIDRKHNSISNLPLPIFLDSLHFHDFTIKYTKEQIITLTRYIQTIYPQVYLNNNQSLDYKGHRQPVDYLCMNPTCREKCTKRLANILYNHGKLTQKSRKHDYSFLLTDQDKIIPSLCCNLCNKIISKSNDNSILFKHTRYINNVYRNITKENSSPTDYALYKTFFRVENIVGIDSHVKMPFATTNTKKGYTWRKLQNVCTDFSFQKLIERQIAIDMKKSTIQRKIDDMYSQPISLPNDGTTIRLSTKHVNQTSQGRKRISISFLDSNGKKYTKKLNDKKEFEFQGVVYQLVPDPNIDNIEKQIIDSYLEENGFSLNNLKDHALDQLQLQMDDYGQLLCDLTKIKLNFEKGSLFYLSPERLDQSKPYLYKKNSQIQRNFVFIAQLLNTPKQMTQEKWLKICLSYYINEHYGVTIDLCHRVSKKDYHDISPERVNIIQKHLASVQKTYDECIDYSNKSHGEKRSRSTTKPVLYESLRIILDNIKKTGNNNKSKQGDISRIEQLLDIWKNNYGLCHYSECKMNLETGPDHNFQLSPERLNDSGSYSEHNVRFICAELNVGKNTGISDSNESGSNSKKILRELIESTIQHYKFEKNLEKRYYTEDEINSIIQKHFKL